MTYRSFLVLLMSALLWTGNTSFSNNREGESQTDRDKNPGDTVLMVPVGGNTWVQNIPPGSRVITNAGIENWTDEAARFDTYFRISHPGKVRIKIRAKAAGESRLQVAVNNIPRKITIEGDDFRLYEAGEWELKDTGYIKITLTGISKTGARFAEVSDYAIGGSVAGFKTNFVATNEGNFFYWGRRGPSVHLSYPFDSSIRARWFYNEITVPEGEDKLGSYFMANGFGEGYFGIQVNSATERRVLFSVWSPYSTDDPKSIPENMRITMLKKGEGVHTGEFGNEGSGGQSYWRYNWKAGVTYRFLLKGEPDGNNNTIYTAYFFTPETDSWNLVASFKRPQTNTYLKRFHSFLENFSPNEGDKERKVLFNNQWVGDINGNWTELTKAVFTYDNTAAKGYRMDYAGGLQGQSFYLKNCGFFKDYTPYRSAFTRNATNRKPLIDLEKLP